MAAPAGGGAQSTESGALWIVVAIFVFLFMFWYFAHTQIVIAYFYLKHIEITVIQFFIKGFASVGLEEVRQLIEGSSPDSITFKQLAFVAQEVGYYLRFPFAAILLLFAVLLYNKSTSEHYKHVYSMPTLASHELSIWPHSTPVIGLDLVKEDIDKGAWAMASAPMAFAKKYHLIQEEGVEALQDRTAIKGHYKISLRKDRSARVFSMQLGKQWTTVEQLNDYIKALYAAFAAKAARHSSDCRVLLNQISASSKGGHLDFTGVEELLKKYKNYPPVVEVTDKHAYIYTVMASLLQLARTDGVLPTSEFLWLKPIDRRLWFMLNAVGRQTATVEIAGPFAHWLAEKEIGRRLKTPMVEQAIKGLDLAIHELIYDPNTPD